MVGRLRPRPSATGRAHARRRDDRGLVGIADAFLVLVILGVASVVLLQSAASPAERVDLETRERDLDEAGRLGSALLRSTIERAVIHYGGPFMPVDAERVNSSIASLLSEIHYAESSGPRGSTAQDAARAIDEQARAFGSGRWRVAIQLARADGSDPMCVAAGGISPGRCLVAPQVFTTDAAIPETGAPGARLSATVFMWKGDTQ